MKFWGLLAMIAHIANTTQQNHKDITTKQVKKEAYPYS